MKTLDELCISPIPWRISDDWSCIKDGSKNPVTVCDLPFPGLQCKHKAENAHMLKAAPYMYEALAAMLVCAEKNAPYLDMSHMDMAMDMARKALMKARGEYDC